MTYDVDTQCYLDAVISALDGVYASEQIPVIEGPPERVFALYAENKPTFISVTDELLSFEPSDGFQVMQNTVDLRIDVYVIAAPNDQTDRPVKRARAISDYIIGYLMARNIVATKSSGTIVPMEFRPVGREQITEESVLDGHFSISAQLITHEALSCQ